MPWCQQNMQSAFWASLKQLKKDSLCSTGYSRYAIPPLYETCSLLSCSQFKDSKLQLLCWWLIVLGCWIQQVRVRTS
jgi:hypothetical protein